ncbi:MAG TPA: tetratricopeptide repeat protein [Vicinamibacteria bacterium]|nr:tetratricopeptide repeat protein [Vicinamibacteria bacterium]
MTRVLAASGLAALALAMVGSGTVRVVEAQDAAAALRSGDYDGAIALLRTEVARDPRSAQAHRALARLLLETGRLEEAEAAVRRFHGANPRSAELYETLGDLLAERGRLAEAEAAYGKSVAGRASDALAAELDLAVLQLQRGDGEAARKGFDRLLDAYNESGGRLSSEQLSAVAAACRHLGAGDPQLFKDALKAYDEAIEADPDNLDARVDLAELFLEKYNRADAAETAKAALDRNPSHPRALLAMARIMDFDGAPGVMEVVGKALKVNPNLAAARVFMAEVLLDQEDHEGAAREAEGLLALNPTSLPALSALAAARYLQGDQVRFEEARGRALALNPRNAELYNRLAEMSARNRLFRQAVDFAGQAVALDPRSARGLGIRGLNQLRIGAIEEGRRSLEASFAGDPYNVWIKNTLDLLDTFPRYRETRTPHFLLVVHGKESELLTPYAAALAEEAYETLSARYGYRPEAPVRIEVYPDHADFSVRTIGLAGLAGLGACFGPVLAIDSPSAREVGRFNWGSTLWHELAHTFTLGLTGQKVPRWLTEGLSVHEEHRARPGWGDDTTVEFLQALKAGELLPLAELNSGFVRPKNPHQVSISYYQAGLMVEWIEAQRGFAALRGLLGAYAGGRTTAQAVEKVLGTSTEELDKAFFAHLEQRFAGPLAAIRAPSKVPDTLAAAATAGGAVSAALLEQRAKAHPGDFEAQRAAGVALAHLERREEALPYLERAHSLFPEYGGDDNPLWYLAGIYKERGKPRQAAEALTRLTTISDSHYRAHLELSALLEEQGDLAGAARILERALYISPFEAAVHERMAALYARLGDPAGVVRARRSLVALDPVDRAEALYQLALALSEAGDERAARREVLRALELAPRFQRAQELLLRLHDRREGSGTE